MLSYIALIMLILVVLILFYAIIAIHDIPYEIARRRNHPQQDAIRVAGWVSLLTLHLIWPFLWIWASLNFRPDNDSAHCDSENWDQDHDTNAIVHDLQQQLETQSQRLSRLEQRLEEHT